MPALLDDVDCLEMPDGTWAFSDGTHFWLHRPTPLQDLAFTPSLHPVGSERHTRQLLAAALAAGVARHQLGGARPSEKPSLPRYIYALASNYHTTHATPFTMLHVGARLRNRGDETWRDIAKRLPTRRPVTIAWCWRIWKPWASGRMPS
jgi:hypothetical protein